MEASLSKYEALCEQLRDAFRSGRYLPGQRIDPIELAAECHTSETPVRQALFRLEGEGLVDNQVRGGRRVPLPTESDMRARYDWMRHLLLTACERGQAATAHAHAGVRAQPAAAPLATPQRTWRLFDAIARSAGHPCLYRAARQANDLLAPIRQAEQRLLGETEGEISRLERYWQDHQLEALMSSIDRYHVARTEQVADLVAWLNEQARAFR